MPLLAISLICSMSVYHDQVACTRETANIVFVTPAVSPMDCLKRAQEQAAGSGFLEGDDRYLRIMCERRPQT